MFYVYLDTSFLSQLTKAARETPRGSVNAVNWISLLTTLRQKVESATLLCPASQFQTQEAMLAEGILQEFISLQCELSKGYYFREWQDILVHQAASRLLIYLGRPQDIDLGWKVLTKEPPLVTSALKTAKMKEEMVMFATLLMNQSPPEASLQKQYESEKIEFLHNSFLEPIRHILGLPTYSQSPDSSFLGMLMNEAKVTNHKLMKALQFFDSALVDEVPFIHIFCSIFASLRFHERERGYTGSEREDAVALACAVPYCQIVTTDTNMKNNIVSRLHLNKKYGISVYAPTNRDLDAFEKALSQLDGG